MTHTVAEGLVLAILALPKVAKEEIIDRLLEDREAREIIVHRLMGSLARPTGNLGPKYTSSPSYAIQPGLTSKEMAKQLRDGYISELRDKGVHIDQVDNVWGKMPDGMWVAFPFATERRSDHWFLGVSAAEALERVHAGGVVVALLCQPASEPNLLDFILPPSVVRDVVDSLSTSGGQLKLNLRKVGSHYYLVIPGLDRLDISSYMGEWTSLRLQAIAPS